MGFQNPACELKKKYRYSTCILPHFLCVYLSLILFFFILDDRNDLFLGPGGMVMGMPDPMLGKCTTIWWFFKIFFTRFRYSFSVSALYFSLKCDQMSREKKYLTQYSVIVNQKRCIPYFNLFNKHRHLSDTCCRYEVLWIRIGFNAGPDLYPAFCG